MALTGMLGERTPPASRARSEAKGKIAMAAVRWLYTMDGMPAYYQSGECIYSLSGKPEFSVAGGRWHSAAGGPAPYYVSDNWVYTLDGKPAFYSR